MGFRYEWEPRDERPCIVYTEPFWANDMERATYEAAVAGNPRQPDEGPLAYARRISRLVTEEYQPKVPVRGMPKAGRVRL